MAETKSTVKKTATATKTAVKSGTTAKKPTATAKTSPSVKPSAKTGTTSAPKKERVEIVPPKKVEIKEEKKDVKVLPKRKILFVASECTPFIATGGLAEVIGSLSKSLAKDENYDVRVVLPLYSDIKKEYKEKFTFLTNIFVPLSWRNQYCGIFHYEENGVQFYFLDNEQYFKRPGCYGYFDDGERFAFFCRAVMEFLPVVGFYPDVLHCHDWQSALAALYLKTIYCFRKEYQFIRAVFTIHNIEYQGQFSLDILEDLFGIPNEFKYLVEYDGCINLMKGAIECSEKFSTVSPTYAQEIQRTEFAHGLQEIIAKNSFKLCGILNGIDVDSYNPKTDPSMFAHYDANDLDNKSICKSELQKMLNLPVRNVPIVAMITRLVPHKGLDLVKAVVEEMLYDDVQFVLLGTGDSDYENYFKDLANRYSGKVVSVIAFNGDLSRKIYAGADIFLMPSRSEPCGLSQMIATRYGTIPVVRETGGLYDSIRPYGAGGNGFTFAAYNAHDMLYVIREAITLYRYKEEWKRLMERAMSSDFSWAHSAKEYKQLYSDTLALQK